MPADSPIPPRPAHDDHPTRRQLIKCLTFGAGGATLTALLPRLAPGALGGAPASPAARDFAATRRVSPRPRATRVIYLFMAGGPSQLELFDPKPALARLDGQPLPASLSAGNVRARLLAPRHRFRKRGQSGLELSEILPHLGRVADHLCLVRSMHGDTTDHAAAQLLTLTGCARIGHPSLGASVSVALGSEPSGLPAHLVLTSGHRPAGGPALWGAGRLPATHRGVPVRAWNDPDISFCTTPGESFPSSASDAMDLAREDEATLDLYGARPGQRSFAGNCLLARRFVERGARFVNVCHGGWDHHSDVAGGTRAQCDQTDRAAAALIMDLKQRGLLDETLVVWTGEFGRSPTVESNSATGRALGRDHQAAAFSAWLAGGGIRPGHVHGETDDLGFAVARDPVHTSDLRATILHLLGVDAASSAHRGPRGPRGDGADESGHGRAVSQILA